MSLLYQTIVWLCFLIKKTPASLIAKVIEKYTPDYLFSDQKIINSLNVQDYNKHLSLGNLYFFKKNFNLIPHMNASA